LTREVAGAVWDQLPQPARDQFIAQAAIASQDIGGNFQSVFETMVGDPRQERELFTGILTGEIRRPGSSPANVLEFYTATGIIKPTERTIVEQTRPTLGGLLGFTRNVLRRNLDNDEPRVYAESVLGSLVKDLSRSAPERAQELFDAEVAIRSVFASHKAAEQSVVQRVAAVQDGLRANANPDSLIFDYTPDQVFGAQLVYPELSSLPMDTMLRAMLVTRGDVRAGAGGASISPTRFEIREAAGTLTPAEQYWRSMGLNPDQMAALTRLAVEGPRELPTYIHELDEFRKGQEQAQNAIETWLAQGGDPDDIPQNLIDHRFIDRDWLLRKGMTPETASTRLRNSAAHPVYGAANLVRNLWEMEVPIQPLAGGNQGTTASISAKDIAVGLGGILNKGIDAVGDGVEAITDFSDIVNDDYARIFAENPDQEFGFSFTAEEEQVLGGVPVVGGIESAALRVLSGVELFAYGTVGLVRDESDPTIPDAPLHTRGAQIHPESRAGGVIRREFSEIYMGAPDGKEGKDRIHDEMLSLFKMQIGSDGIGHLANMAEFNDLVLRQGMSIPDAVDTIAESHLAMSIGIGFDNIFAVGSVFTKTPQAFKFTRLDPSNFTYLAKGTKLNPAVKLSEGTLGVLESRLTQINKAIETRSLGAAEFAPDFRGTVTRGRNPANYMRLTAKEAEELRLEADEIERVLTVAREGDEVITLQRAIHNPNYGASAIIEKWDMLNHFKITRAFNRALAPANEFTQMPWQKAADHARNLLQRPDRAARNLTNAFTDPYHWFKSSQSGRAAQSHLTALQAQRSLQNMIGSLHVASPDVPLGQSLLRTLRQIQEAGKAGLESARRFVVHGDTPLATYLTEDAYTAMEVLARVDLDNLVTLKKDVRIARSPEEYTRMTEEIKTRYRDAASAKNRPMSAQERRNMQAELDATFGSPEHFFVDFQTDLLQNLGAVTNELYNVGEPGVFLRAQGFVQSFLSRVYLSYPGFAVRNVASNIAASMVDSMDPIRLMFSKEHRRMWDRYLVGPPVPVGLSFGINPARDLQDLARQKESFIKAARHQGRLGGFFGDGVIGLGGVPFVNIREASAFMEAWHRTNITTYEFDRLMRGLWEPRAGGRLLSNMTDPDILVRRPELAEVLIANSKDPSRMSVGDILGAVQSTSRDEVLINPAPSAELLAERFGIKLNTVKSEHWGAITDIIKDDTINAVGARARLSNMANDLEALGRAKAAAVGIDEAVHDEFFQMMDDMFFVARETGLPPKYANDLSNLIAGQLAKRVEHSFGLVQELNDWLRDPEMYQAVQFGMIKRLNDMLENNASLEEMVAVGITDRTSPAILQGFMDDAQIFNDPIWDNLIDMAIEGSPLLEGRVDNEFLQVAARARANLHTIRQDLNRYLSTQELKRPRGGYVPTGPEDLAQRNIWNPNPEWTRAQRQAALDKAVVQVARLVPPDFRFAVRGQGSRLMNIFGDTVTEGELRRAVVRNIRNKEIRTNFRKGSRRSFSVSRKEILERGGVVGMPGRPGNVDMAARQFVQDMDRLTMRISTSIVQAAEPAIQNTTQVNRRIWRQAMTNVRDTVSRKFNDARSANGFTPILGEEIPVLAREAAQEAEYIIQQASEEIRRLYSETADLMGMFPISPFSREAAAAAGKVPEDSAINEYARWITENLPVAHVLRELGPRVAELKAQRVTTMDELLALTRDVVYDRDELLEWGSTPTPRELTEQGWLGHYNIKNTLGEVVIEDPNLQVVVATHGLPPGTPGVHGHAFLRRAPQGWRPIITDDSYGAAANRMALYVRNDASREEIARVAREVKKAHEAAILRSNGKPRVASALSKARRDFQNANGRRMTDNVARNNPLGYHASQFVETENDVVGQLAPFVKMVNEGDPDADVALAVIAYAKKQRVEGWPITGEPPTSYRNMMDVFNDFKGRRNLERVRASSAAVPMTRAEYDDIRRGVRGMLREKNQMTRFAMEAGAARADWVLHNYANTNDLDFLLRFMSPWHIWPTRTMAKLSLRALNNPATLTGLTQYLRVMHEKNEDLPEYLRDQLPLPGWALAPLQAIGLVDENPIGSVDPAGLLFWSDLVNTTSLDDFTPGGDAQYNAFGQTLNKLDTIMGPLGITPIATSAASLFGAFGERDDPLSRFAGTQLRRANALLYFMEETTDLTGLDIPYPRYVYATTRDLNRIRNQFFYEIERSIRENGPNRANNSELDELLTAYDVWNTKDKIGVREQILTNAAYGVSGDLIDRVIQDSRRNEALGTTTATLFGARMNILQSDFDQLQDLLDKLSDGPPAGATDAEVSAWYSELYDNHPAFSNWLEAQNYNGVPAMAKAETEFFVGITPIDEKYDQEIRARNLLFPSTAEDQRALEDIIARKNGEIDALARAVQEKYGIEPEDEEHPTGMFNNIAYRLSAEDIETLVGRYMGLEPEHIQMLAQVESLVTRMFGSAPTTLTEDQTRALFEDASIRRLTDEFPYLYSTGVFNPRLINSIITKRILQLDAELDPDKFRINKRGFGPTNAVDWEAYNARKKELRATMTASEWQTIQQVKTKNSSLDEAIAGALNVMFDTAQNNYYTTLGNDALDAVSRAQAIDNITRGIEEEVTPRRVYNVMMAEFGHLWRDGRAETDEEIMDYIAGYLAQVDIDLIATIDGRYDVAAQKLAEDFQNGVEEPRHFRVPVSNYVITTPEELERFIAALDFNNEISRLRDKGFDTGFIKPSVSQVTEDWYRFFWRDGEERITQQEIIDALFALGTRKGDDAAYALIDFYQKERSGTGADTEPSNFYNPDGSVNLPSDGIKSAGHSPTRGTSRYRFDYINTPLSRQGQMVRAFMNSQYFAGQFAENAPPDYVYELMARNGVTTREDIIDFFHSVYNAGQGVFGDAFAANDLVTNVLLGEAHEPPDERTGESRLPTYRYIQGIRGLYESVFNVPRSVGGSSAPTSSFTANNLKVEPLRDARNTRTSRTGRGGLPQWSEAVDWMQNVFHDTSLAEDLVQSFMNSRHRLSRQHMLQLRYMFRFFDVGIDVSFDEWLEALRLMWQTTAVRGPNPTVVNRGFSGRNEAPRLARYAQG